MAANLIDPSVPEEQVSNAEDVNRNPESESGHPDDYNTAPAQEAEQQEQHKVAKVPRPRKSVAEKVAAPATEGVDDRSKEAKEPEDPVAAEGITRREQEEDEDGGVATGEDFSEEEALLAAEAPEFDLGDHEEDGELHHESDGDEMASPDLGAKNKPELIEIFAELLATRAVQSLRRDAEAIKIAFYRIHRNEVEQLRKLYIESGGNADDFVAPDDEQERRLKELFVEYRRKRDDFTSNLEAQKEENLKAKLQIIEELKELIGSGETLNHTFNAFRDLQHRWKETGPVPQANVKDLWETYNHHVENFYSFIKINKELRDLDLKRNYEAKVKLCEEAEVLVLEPSIVNAFHKLQKMHELWRETGPVANEFKESVWERFKEASSRINKQHQEYFDTIKNEQKRNYDLKSELCVKAEELAAGAYTSRKEWNRASDKLIEVQKVWKTIGYAPKKENARVYERFRNACDAFFEQKRRFYLQLKAEMEHNLQLKQEICLEAESLKESDQWKKAADELMALQKRWKEIGPVSRRHSDAIWKRFRAACDYFFDRKSKHFSEVDSQYAQNLQAKRDLLGEIEIYSKSDMGGGMEAIREFQRRWGEIGFVPIKHKEAIQGRYKELVDVLFSALRGGEQERRMERFKGRISNLRETGDRRLKSERERLYNKVRQLESDIALLENNIGFFSKSKNAEAMIRDVREKIERSRQEMAQTIEKINLIDKEEK